MKHTLYMSCCVFSVLSGNAEVSCVQMSAHWTCSELHNVWDKDTFFMILVCTIYNSHVVKSAFIMS
uniref:Uncharacterized protein n=1 Tax=Anguilla anguilla TaxID=7936 RepID=A0A0E9V5Q2_ANGAN